jgi:NADH dehydrogenase (ubiquinone) 1 beta subcomplex subunit 7
MSSWSVFRQINKDAVTSPKSFEEPTFDPQDGFDGKRKERAKLWTDAEMDALDIAPADRNYCSHLLIPFHKCRVENWPLMYRCGHEKHAYAFCDVMDKQLRIKEWERERRLRLREKEKAKLEVSN